VAIGPTRNAPAAAIVLWAKLRGDIAVPGYTPLVLVIMFFGGLTTLALGIVGQYLSLTLQNARRRPNFVIRSRLEFAPRIETRSSERDARGTARDR
jgi:hypothetical protein